MSTNLIDNYINLKNTPAMANPSVAHKSEVKTPITKIRPLKPKGHLVNSTLFDVSVDMLKGVAYDIKSLNNGLKGDSNDHQLGKINDLGMKLGGLAIAGLLFTQKKTPKTKWMEFIGFGSFFASMAVWPKIAFQLPARAVHGFNVQQKYEDSMGRKKSFFSDPQYLPWDLYSDKEINKIGDRLGVDRDVPNRREFVQEKMKKIAIQNNTMWMLTAGFATPIMSALICNGVEKHLGEYLDKKQNKKAENLLTNLDKEAEKLDFSEYDKALSSLLQSKKNAPLTPEMCEEIAKAMVPTMPKMEKYLAKDLTKMFVSNETCHVIDDKSIEVLLSEMNKTLGYNYKLNADQLNTFMPKKEEVIKLLQDNELFNTKLDEDAMDTAAFKINKLMKNKRTGTNYEKMSGVFSADSEEAFEKGLKLNPTNLLNDSVIERLNGFSKPIRELEKRARILDTYSHTKFAGAPETVHANQWNELTPKLLKILDLTPEEIKRGKIDRLEVLDIIRNKFENITSDDKKFEQVMNDIAGLIKSFGDKILPDEVNRYCEKTDKVYNKAAAELLSLGFGETSNQLSGWKIRQNEIQDVVNKLNNENRQDWDNDYIRNKLSEWGMDSNDFNKAKDSLNKAINTIKDKKSSKEIENVFNDLKAFNMNEIGAYKNFKKDFAKTNRPGIKANFFRLIDTLDLYRRVSKQEFGSSLTADMRREIIEEALESAKMLITSGHAADYSVKLYVKRNPTPDAATGLPEVINGKVQNKFFGRYGQTVKYKGKDIPYQTVDIPRDSKFFQKVMQFLFGNDLHKTTKDALGDALATEVGEHNKSLYNKLGNIKSDFKPEHGVSNIKEATNSEKLFKLVGLASDEMMTKLFNNDYNSSKWMKIFGTSAIVLTGVTVASQFFFGNMRDPKKIKKEGDE